MTKLINRIQVGIALTSSLATLALCVAALTVAPSLGLVAGLCGLGTAANWLLCDPRD